MTDREYTGGSVSYYTCSVTHPISETADPYDAECIDIIDALQMTPNEANAFKALWRRAAARLGKSKRGYTDGLYDAEKVEFYGKRLVELERRARPAEEPDPIVKKHVDKILKGEVSFPEGIVGCAIEKAFGVRPVTENPFGPRDADGWYTWNGDDTMRPAGYVQIADREGEISTILASESLRWDHWQTGGDIVKWRPAENQRINPVRCCDRHPDCMCGMGADGL